MPQICNECEAFFPDNDKYTQHKESKNNQPPLCQQWQRPLKTKIILISGDGTKAKDIAPQQRIAYLGAVADAALADMQDCEVCIIIAAEFFFWNVGTSNPPLPEGMFGQTDYDDIINQLRQLSAKYKDILFCPGTIPVGRPERITKEEKTENAQRLKATPIANKDKLPEGVAFHYLTEEIDQQMAQVTAGNGVMYSNRAETYMAGKLLLSYAKQIAYWNKNLSDLEYHWVPKNGNIMHAPPENASRVPYFNVNGIRIGIEICAEAQYGVLGASGAPSCQMHIVMANSLEEDFHLLWHLSEPRGYYIHVDAKKEYNAVMLRQADIQPGDEQKVQCAEFNKEVQAQPNGIALNTHFPVSTCAITINVPIRMPPNSTSSKDSSST